MDALWWFAAIVVMAVGLIGTVLPVVPGTTIILAAAIVHRIMVGRGEGDGLVEHRRARRPDARLLRDRIR